MISIKNSWLKYKKKKFTNEDFLKLSNGQISSLKIESINDVTKFTNDSVKLLYTIGVNNFSLISDEKNNVYIAKIKKIYENNLIKNSQESKTFTNQANIKIKDRLYNSYDFLLNEKYKIKVNEKTLDRMKNYFR